MSAILKILMRKISVMTVVTGCLAGKRGKAGENVSATDDTNFHDDNDDGVMVTGVDSRRL